MHEQLGRLSLAYDEWGSADPPLVLVHGLAASRSDWSPFVADWSRSRRVIAYDQRGHGDSSHLGQAEAYRLAQLVDDLAALLDRRAPSQVDLLGHSLGGVVAMKLALCQPGRVRSLVLVNAAATPAAPVPAEVVTRLAELGRTQGMAKLASVIDRISDSPAGRRSPAQSQRFREDFSKTDVEAYQALSIELGSYPSMLDRMPELDMPVTVILGEYDELIRAEADATVAALPDARLAVVPDAAHLPQVENPDGWVAAVDSHLSHIACYLPKRPLYDRPL